MKRFLSAALITAMFITSANITTIAASEIKISPYIGTDGMIEVTSTEDMFADNEFVLSSGTQLIKMNVLEEKQNSVIIVPDRKLEADTEYVLRDTAGNVNHSFTTVAAFSEADIMMDAYTDVAVDSDIVLNSDLALTDVSEDTVKLYSYSGEECEAFVSYNGSIIITPNQVLDKGNKYYVKLDGVKDEDRNVLKKSVAFITQAPSKVDIHPYIKDSVHQYKETGAWAYSSVKGYNNSQTKYSTGGTAATYIPVLCDYNYNVSVYILYHSSDKHTEATFEIKHENATETITVPIDRTLEKSYWHDFGTFKFSAGNENYVKLVAKNGANSYSRTSYVRFTPVEDTSNPTAEISYDKAVRVKFSKPMNSSVVPCVLNDGTNEITAELVSNDNLNYILVHKLENNTEYSITLNDITSFDGYTLDETIFNFKTEKTVKMPVLFKQEADKIVYETYIEGETDAYIFAYSFDENGVIQNSSSSPVADGAFSVELDGAEKETSSAVILRDIANFKPYGTSDTVSQFAISEVKYENQKLEITSQSQNFTEGEEIAFTVLDKNGKPVYFKTVKMSDDGINTITIDIPDEWPGGSYSIIANSETAKIKAEDSFYNINSFTIQKAIDDLNGCETTTEVENIVLTYYRELNLDENDIKHYKEIDKDTVNEKLSKATFSTTDEVNALFKETVAIEAVNQLDNYGELINEYKAVFGVDTAVYEEIDEKGKIDNLFKNYVPLESGEKVKTAFDKVVALQSINEASWGGLEEIFTDNEELLEIDLTKYNNLSSDKQKIAAKKVKETSYYNKISDFVKEFNKAVDYAKSYGKNQSPGGSSGGGGGGSTVMNIATVNKVKTDDVTHNPDSMQYGFTDLAEVEWAKKSIEALFEKGVVDGYGDATFRGNGLLTREAFVKMIVLAFEIKPADNDIAYSDVPSDHWAYNYVNIAASNGIINGVSENRFGVGGQLTRQDMATILYRTVKLLNIELPSDRYEINFIDAVNINEYAVEAISKLQLAGIINGVSENEYNPNGETTRAMAAKVIYETLKNR